MYIMNHLNCLTEFSHWKSSGGIKFCPFVVVLTHWRLWDVIRRLSRQMCPNSNVPRQRAVCDVRQLGAFWLVSCRENLVKSRENRFRHPTRISPTTCAKKSNTVQCQLLYLYTRSITSRDNTLNSKNNMHNKN